MFRRTREIEPAPTGDSDCGIPVEIGGDLIGLAACCQSECSAGPVAVKDAEPTLVLVNGQHSVNGVDSGMFSELTPKCRRSLESIKGVVAKEHELVRRSFRDALTHAKAAGEALSRIETLVPHGHSTKVRALLCDELGISERTGRVYLQVFSGWDVVEAEIAKHSLIPDTSQFSIRQALAVIRTAKVNGAQGTNGSTASVSVNVSNGEGHRKEKTMAKSSSNGRARHPSQAIEPAEANESPFLVPDVILTRALELVGGTFTLDATSEPSCSRVPAELHYTENALSEPWFDKVFLHLTPGMAMDKWVDKLAHHLLSGEDHVSECLLVLPVDTASKWFEKLVRQNVSVVFCKERLTFYGEVTPATFPSLVAYVGDQHGRFAELFAALGPVLRSTDAKP